MNLLIDSLFFGFIGIVTNFVALFFGAALLYMPVSLKADAACAKLGYPASKVTYDFEVYCMTIDGAVQTKIVKP